MALLKVKNLYKHFPIHRGVLLRETSRAAVLNGISFELATGEILGIVGESGCGKSTLARLIMRILEPSAGQIQLDEVAIQSFPRQHYFHRVQMIFQDPYSSLNPKMTVAAHLSEMIHMHQPSKNVATVCKTMMEEVGLPQSALYKFPHEFSGGQRQRIAIARALSANPTLLIADEPVSALDVSIQAQILNLLKDLQQQHQLSLLFISHDLEIVDFFCDRILVMYLGKIVEELQAKTLRTHSQHPYTHALLQCMPTLAKKATGLQILKGEIPSPLDLPKGCGFYSRCNRRKSTCQQQFPLLLENIPQHKVACWDINP